MKRLIPRWLARWLGGLDHRAPNAAPDAAPAGAPAGDLADAGMPTLDCETVMRQLWDYLDGELTPDRMAAMRAHIELCKRCHPQYEFERAFLDAVAATARAHSDPDRLRQKLAAALKARGLRDA